MLQSLLTSEWSLLLVVLVAVLFALGIIIPFGTIFAVKNIYLDIMSGLSIKFIKNLDRSDRFTLNGGADIMYLKRQHFTYVLIRNMDKRKESSIRNRVFLDKEIWIIDPEYLEEKYKKDNLT